MERGNLYWKMLESVDEGGSVMRWMVRIGCSIMFISNHSCCYLKEDLI